MNYSKPAITLIDAAKSAIQGTPKKTVLAFDAPEMTEDYTVASIHAYEADE